MLVPYARWPRKRRIEILYYPGPGFDAEDNARMDSIKGMFPDADVFLYRTMFDHAEGLADRPTVGYTDHRFGQRSVFPDPEPLSRLSLYPSRTEAHSAFMMVLGFFGFHEIVMLCELMITNII